MKAIHAALALSALLATGAAARASIAYGSINNFDTVNDTGRECHGFEIELDDIHSTEITYTYNYNHYGVPHITEDNSVAGHPKVFIRWESAKNADGTWAAYTAIPAGPIAPTNGHMFTNPAVNFGGEHFGAGYTVPPSAVKYSWLVDNGAGVLVSGGAVQVSTPTFTYFPPVAGGAAPAQVQAVIAPPPPPVPPPLQFGKAVWVKEIKTTTHNANKVALRELVSDDPANPNDKNWKNGEPDEVEVEWRILQKNNGAPDGGVNNQVPAAPEALPGGNEVVTRRYEFYKYVGPLDAETGQAMGDLVGPDGIHGSGSATFADHFDGAIGEWVTVTVDLSTKTVVGDFTGAQMAAVDVDAAVGLIEHVSEGKVNTPYTARRVVVEGSWPFTCTREGALPPGMTFDEVTGVLSGTPTASGQYQFKVTATDGVNPDVSKNYTLTIAAPGAAPAPASLIDTTASPVGSGTTTGDGSYAPGSNVTVNATASPGFHFVNWTDNGQVVSNVPGYTFAIDVNHSLVANFAADVVQWNIATSSAPIAGGVTSGGGTVDDGASVTVVATPNAGYVFTNWTEGGAPVSASASYTFTAAADRALVANFAVAPTYAVSTSGAPLAGGSTSGGGNYAGGTNVTVTATPNAGYTFVNWTAGGTQVSNAASYTFAVAANTTLVANFSAVGGVQRTVTTSSTPAAGGVVSGAGTYADGSSVTVVATPNAGYRFSKWKEGGSNVSSSASYTFTIAANRALEAVFIQSYSITASALPANGGTTEMDSLIYKPGDTAQARAFPASGWAFVNWTEGGVQVSTSNPYSFAATGDRTLVANFQPSSGFTIGVSASPVAGGTTSGGGSYASGASVTLTAVPNAGYSFTNWTEGGTSLGNATTLTFTAAANRTIVANFAAAPVTYTVAATAAPVEGGAVSGAGTFAGGSTVQLTATANAGYQFSNWTEGANVVSNAANFSFVLSGNRTLAANFTYTGATISTSALPAAGGTVTGGGVVSNGSAVTLTAVPATGYQFTKWTEGGLDVSTSPTYTFTAAGDRSLVANFALSSGGAKFDFDTSVLPAVTGQAVPLTQMAGGVTATFSVPAGDPFSVGDAATTGYVLSGLQGRYLVPGAASAMLDVQFDQMITSVKAAFALVESAGLAKHSTVKLTAYDTSSGTPVEVGSSTATGSVVAGDSLAGGTLDCTASAPFNVIRIEVSQPAQAGVRFLCDNIAVTPNSAGGFLMLANPNWNITLTDSGYSDYLIDNTPGFVGREYLSGEWGAACAYKAGAATVKPTWLEPNFVYPDWVTNSNFHVVQPIALIGSNADNLPVAQSVIANNDIEITLRYEMIDTVTGVPMGVSAASAGGAGNSINSNRYVLNQTYTVRNISGSTLTNLQFFQFLHGFTSQHGVYDNRIYAGKLPDYHFDVTLAGIDASTIGAAGSSATGLEDFIGFGAKVAPSAFEIGHYGIEGNGVDDHVLGKPSDGLHLSIEDNWSSAPYSSRKGTDSFAPAQRWVAGAQRFELGTLASGQSVSIDVTLSILTGTTVTLSGGGGGGGGGNTGSGSCNGGSKHVGGVDFSFENITGNGVFFGQESEADEAEINERAGDGEFVLPNFARPGGPSQVWNLKYSGSFTGNIHLTFAYDPALLPAGTDPKKLTLYHFHGGVWEQLVGAVDPVNHTIRVTTDGLSPFMLGVAAPDAIPAINLTRTAPGTLQLTWTSSTTGWILQENPGLDPAGWVNSARAVTTNGNQSQVTVTGAGSSGFFRLVHP